MISRKSKTNKDLTTEHTEHAAILLIAIYLFRVRDTYKTTECKLFTAENAEDAEKNKTNKSRIIEFRFLTEIGIKDSSNMINGIIKRNRKKLMKELLSTR